MNESPLPCPVCRTLPENHESQKYRVCWNADCMIYSLEFTPEEWSRHQPPRGDNPDFMAGYAKGCDDARAPIVAAACALLESIRQQAGPMSPRVAMKANQLRTVIAPFLDDAQKEKTDAG